MVLITSCLSAEIKLFSQLMTILNLSSSHINQLDWEGQLTQEILGYKQIQTERALLMVPILEEMLEIFKITN